MNEKGSAYEFRTIGDATIYETWRATVPEGPVLTGPELQDRLREELHAGRVDFVEQSTEEERDRELIGDSIEEAGPEPEPAYTVVGRYRDNDQTWIETIYTREPSGLPALARRVCAEAAEMPVDELDLDIVAIFEGEPAVTARGDEAEL